MSRVGRKLAASSGINELMLDLGGALSEQRDMLMLGGGNPAHIPEVQRRFRESMERILGTEGAFERCIGNYDAPQGNAPFIEAMAALLRREFGWDVGPGNIALTNGSQTAFFALFNMFAGVCEEGNREIRRKILLPLTPEYIGYADVGLTDDFFVTLRPEIEFLGDRFFKYHIRFESLSLDEEIGAICVSRPTNPTGNVLTDSEIDRLVDFARQCDVPLIVDNAYGTPFPNIIFTEARPVWNERAIVCMSLSKLGLPAARTGIVIAREEIIEAIAAMNAVTGLAPGGLGASLAADMVRTGEVIAMSREVIRPYYETKMKRAVGVLQEELKGVDFYIHKPEGALFLWLWFPDLPITSRELYERLKRRGVLVVSGHYFFPGLRDPWRHTDECIRVTYSQDDAVVSAGLKIIAEEVRRAYVGLR